MVVIFLLFSYSKERCALAQQATHGLCVVQTHIRYGKNQVNATTNNIHSLDLDGIEHYVGLLCAIKDNNNDSSGHGDNGDEKLSLLRRRMYVSFQIGFTHVNWCRS